MAIVDDDIERIRSTVSIVDVVSQHVQLRKTGRNWVGLCPFHAEKTPSFNVREETGRYKCFGCDASGDVFTFVQEIDHVDFVGAVEQLAGQGRDPTHVHDHRPQQGAGPPQAARRCDGEGGRLVPRPAPERSRRARGARLPPQPWSCRRRRADVQDRLGARRLGCAVARRRDRARPAPRQRAGVLEPIGPVAGRVPRPRAVPDLQRERRAGRCRRPDPAGIDGPGEVQELPGDADLHEVEDAVRAQLGQGRHRRRRPGDRVRGLHRRDRLPPSWAAVRRGDVRHGVHRGARPPAQAIREPGRAGVRRRRGGPGRGRAVLRVGAEVPGRGQRGAVSRRARTRGSWRSPIRTPSRRPSARRCRSSASGSTGCSRASRRSRRSSVLVSARWR